MDSLDVVTNIFTYPLNEGYLTVPAVNPCINTIQGGETGGEAWTDG